MEDVALTNAAVGSPPELMPSMGVQSVSAPIRRHAAVSTVSLVELPPAQRSSREVSENVYTCQPRAIQDASSTSHPRPVQDAIYPGNSARFAYGPQPEYNISLKKLREITANPSGAAELVKSGEI